MNKQGSADSTSSNMVRLHRVLASKPDKVYRAFTTANAMARWLPPNGFTCTVHEMDSKVGGTYRMSFIISPREGRTLSAASTSISFQMN
jgi:uncharacterized protein YndB with AHSA1/START domain